MPHHSTAVSRWRRGAIGDLIAGVMILTAGCSADDAPAPAAPVVVYAAYKDVSYLRGLFADYSRESGAMVILRSGAAGDIVDDLIANAIDPPADLLLTPTVNGVYRAAGEGALRPLMLPALAARVPQRLRDPEGYWLPLSFRRVAIVFNPAAVTTGTASDYESLAGAPFHGSLCLSSAALPVNRSVIAALIAQKGVRGAELVVRGWVANLARPVFTDEASLLAAIASGECGLGVVSGELAANLPTVVPDPPVVDIEGLGIARHARNPSGAAQLIEWLLSDTVQAKYAADNGVAAATGSVRGSGNVGLAAWYDEDAARLAQRARFR